MFARLTRLAATFSLLFTTVTPTWAVDPIKFNDREAGRGMSPQEFGRGEQVKPDLPRGKFQNNQPDAKDIQKAIATREEKRPDAKDFQQAAKGQGVTETGVNVGRNAITGSDHIAPIASRENHVVALGNNATPDSRQVEKNGEMTTVTNIRVPRYDSGKNMPKPGESVQVSFTGTKEDGTKVEGTAEIKNNNGLFSLQVAPSLIGSNEKVVLSVSLNGKEIINGTTQGPKQASLTGNVLDGETVKGTTIVPGLKNSDLNLVPVIDNGKLEAAGAPTGTGAIMGSQPLARVRTLGVNVGERSVKGTVVRVENVLYIAVIKNQGIEAGAPTGDMSVTLENNAGKPITIASNNGEAIAAPVVAAVPAANVANPANPPLGNAGNVTAVAGLDGTTKITVKAADLKAAGMNPANVGQALGRFPKFS